MVKILINLFFVSLAWIASLVLPHFQPGYNIFFLFVSASIFLIIFLSMQRVPFQNSPISFYHLSTFGLIFAIEIVLLMLACFKISKPYMYFSRLGSYTMFSNGELMLFGDLRHLTSVVHCPVNIKVGENICDIWGRHFNQNPDVGEFFRLFSFSDARILGVVSTAFFFLIILILLGKLKPSFTIASIIFFTPPVVLAIDRGNEIITISLILLGVLISHQRGSSNIVLVLLMLASIFKFWPFALLIFWTIFSKAFSFSRKFLIVVISVSYLLFHFDNLRQIAQVTQQGDVNGGSFGIALINFTSVYGWVSIVLILIGTIFLFKTTSESEADFETFLRSNPLLVSLIFTYVVLFLSGIHFNYRLIILLPISILLWKNSLNMNLLIFILALMITSRLNIGVVSTSILFVYFTRAFLKYLVRAFQTSINNS